MKGRERHVWTRALLIVYSNVSGLSQAGNGGKTTTLKIASERLSVLTSLLLMCCAENSLQRACVCLCVQTWVNYPGWGSVDSVPYVGSCGPEWELEWAPTGDSFHSYHSCLPRTRLACQKEEGALTTINYSLYPAKYERQKRREFFEQ